MSDQTRRDNRCPPSMMAEADPAIEVVNVDSLVMTDDERDDQDTIFDNLSLPEDELIADSSNIINNTINRNRRDAATASAGGTGGSNNGIRPLLGILRRSTPPPAVAASAADAYLPDGYRMQRNNAMATARFAPHPPETADHDDISVAATEVSFSTTDGSLIIIPRAALMKNDDIAPKSKGVPSSNRNKGNAKLLSSPPPLPPLVTDVIDLENPDNYNNTAYGGKGVINKPNKHTDRDVALTSNGGVVLSKRCIKLLLICLLLLTTLFLAGIVGLTVMKKDTRSSTSSNNLNRSSNNDNDAGADGTSSTTANGNDQDGSDGGEEGSSPNNAGSNLDTSVPQVPTVSAPVDNSTFPCSQVNGSGGGRRMQYGGSGGGRCHGGGGGQGRGGWW